MRNRHAHGQCSLGLPQSSCVCRISNGSRVLFCNGVHKSCWTTPSGATLTAFVRLLTGGRSVVLKHVCVLRKEVNQAQAKGAACNPLCTCKSARYICEPPEASSALRGRVCITYVCWGLSFQGLRADASLLWTKLQACLVSENKEIKKTGSVELGPWAGENFTSSPPKFRGGGEF